MKVKKEILGSALATTVGVILLYQLYRADDVQIDIRAAHTDHMSLIEINNDISTTNTMESAFSSKTDLHENTKQNDGATLHAEIERYVTEEDIAEWRRSRGVFTNEELSFYRDYEESDLLSLAESGDLLAIEVLRDASEDERELFLERNLMAAAAGSTHALTQWNVFFHNDVVEADFSGNYDRVRELYLDRLANFEIALRRGDVSAWKEGQRHMEHYFQKYGGSALTENDIRHVSSVADKRLSAIENYRITRYWPEFDNSPDPSIISSEYRTQIHQELAAVMSANFNDPSATWGSGYLEALLTAH